MLEILSLKPKCPLQIALDLGTLSLGHVAYLSCSSTITDFIVKMLGLQSSGACLQLFHMLRRINASYSSLDLPAQWQDTLDRQQLLGLSKVICVLVLDSDALSQLHMYYSLSHLM